MKPTQNGFYWLCVRCLSVARRGRYEEQCGPDVFTCTNTNCSSQSAEYVEVEL